MKPQLGDTILNRYTLVSSLREEPGIQAWKANDRVLAKDCQLFIITDRSAFAAIDKLAGRIAATRPDRVIPHTEIPYGIRRTSHCHAGG